MSDLLSRMTSIFAKTQGVPYVPDVPPAVSSRSQAFCRQQYGVPGEIQADFGTPNGIQQEGIGTPRNPYRAPRTYGTPQIQYPGGQEVAFEERAAIIEYDGDVPRVWAEALARLDPTRPPADVPPKRWVRFLNDCGTFVDSAWANRASELGWTPLDLFGCHNRKPYARLSHCGLLWFVNGRRILSMDADRVLIETETGSAAYRRVPTEIGQICVWELKREKS